MGCGSSLFKKKKNDESVAEPGKGPLVSSTKQGSSRSLAKSMSFRRADSSRSAGGLLGNANDSKHLYGPEHHRIRKTTTESTTQQSKYIRLMIGLPFKHNATAAELFCRCVFPALRDHCRKHGWNLLVIETVDEVDLDLGLARPDTLQLCRSELAKCLEVSAGPALICMVDNSYELIEPLPPPLIPASEFEAIINHLRKSQKEDAAAMADEELGQVDVEDISHVALLTRWYRQTRRYGAGGKAGEYAMCVPIDLSADSIFRESGRAMTSSERRHRQGREIAALARVLTGVAAAGLIKDKDSKVGVRFGAGKEGKEEAEATEHVGVSDGEKEEPMEAEAGQERNGARESLVEDSGEGLNPEGGDDPLKLDDLEGGRKYSSARAVAVPEGNALSGQRISEGARILEDDERDPDDGGKVKSRSSVRFGPTEGGNGAKKAGGLKGQRRASAQTGGGRTGSDGAGMTYSDKTAGVLHKFESGFFEQALGQVLDARGQTAFILPPEGIQGPPEPIDASFLDDSLPKDQVDPPGKWKMSTFSHATALKEAKGSGPHKESRLASVKAMMRPGSFKGKPDDQKVASGKVGRQRLPRDVRKKLRAMRAKGEEADGDEDEDEAGKSVEGAGDTSSMSAGHHGVDDSAEGGHASMLASARGSTVGGLDDASVGGSVEMSMTSKHGGGAAGLSMMSGVSAVSGLSGTGEVIGSAVPFSRRGRGLTVGVDKAEVKGVPTNSSVYLDLYVVSSVGQDAPNMQTSKKKHDGDGVWVWRKLAAVSVEGKVLDEGMLHVRVMEKGSAMRSDKLQGTYTVGLNEVSVFEDNPQDSLPKQKWIVLSGNKEPPKDLPSSFEVSNIPMIRVRLIVRAQDSGRALLRESIRLGNSGEVERALEHVEQAKRKLLRALNQSLASRAVKVEDELEARLRLVNDKTLRRLHWLQKKVGTNGDDAFVADETEGKVVVQGGAPGGTLDDVWEAIQVARDHPVKGGWARGKSRADEDNMLMFKMPPLVKAALAQVILGLKESLDPFLGLPVPFMDPLKREIAAHHDRRDELTQGFVGRQEILEVITKYCFDGNSKASPVFILEGQVNGNGLSSVMASVSTAVEKVLVDRTIGALFVTRFIGSTARSQDVNTLLHSMILQLECQLALDTSDGEHAWQHNHGKPPWQALQDRSSEWFMQQRKQQQPPASYSTLCARMKEIVLLASQRKPLIIILDGMDELHGWLNDQDASKSKSLMIPWEGFGDGNEGSGESAAAILHRLLAWLPFENPADPQLPPHVRVVLSYCSKSEATKAVLQPLTAKGNIAQLKGVKCELGDDGAEPMLHAMNSAAGNPLPTADLAMLDPAHSEQAAADKEEKKKPAPCEPLALSLAFKVKVSKHDFGKSGKGSSLLRRSHDEGALHNHRRTHDICKSFMQQLAEWHGRPLLNLCLRVLLASSAGLAEDELLDILTVVPPRPARMKPAPASIPTGEDDADAEQAPPELPRRDHSGSQSNALGLDEAGVSVLDALRLIRDIKPLLRERLVDGMQVMDLSHTAIKDCAKRFACEDAADLERAHGTLAAYFTGRESKRGWMGTEQPETAGAEEAKKWMKKWLHRPLFPVQPWYWTLNDDPLARYFGDTHGSTHHQGSAMSRSASFTSLRHRSGDGRRRILNLRKLRELVPQLVGAGMIDSAVHIVTDLHYCLLKCESGALSDLAREYQLIQWHRTQSAHGFSRFLDGCGEFHRFLMLHRAELTLHPLMMFQLAANSQGTAPSKAAMRLLDKGMERPPWIQCLNPETPDTLHPRWTLEGHKEQVTCLAMTSDGSILLSISSTNVPRIWQTANGKMVQELPPHGSRVVCVALARDDSHYAVGDVDGTIKMWPLVSLDVPSASTVKHGGADRKTHADFGVQAHNGPVRALAFLPVKGMLLSCGADGAVKLWSTTKGSAIQMLKGHTGSVNGVMISAQSRPGGVTNALKGNMAATVGFTWSVDGTVKEWQVEKGRCTKTFAGHSGPITSVDTLASLDVLVSGSEDFTCRVWRRSDAAKLAVLNHRAPVVHVRLDAEAEALATVDKEGRLRVWDVRTYVNIGSCDALGMQSTSPGWQADILPCAGSHESGMLVLGCKDGAMKAYSFRSVSFLAHAPLQPLSGRRETGVVAMSITSSSLATAGEGGQVASWELKTGDCKTKFNTNQGRVSSVALEPTAGWLLATASVQGNVLFWDIRHEDSAPIAGLGAHFHGVNSVCFATDGTLFATASTDATLRVWQTTLPHQPGRRSSLNSSHALSPVRHNSSTVSPVSPTLPGLPLSSPNNHSLYTSFNSSTVGPPPAACFSLRPLHTLTGHKEAVLCAEFSSPHPTRLASSSLDSSIIVWDMSTGVKERVIKALGTPMVSTCLAWSPGGEHIASGGDDSLVRIWSAESGREKLALKGRRRVDPLADLTIESLVNGALWNARQSAVEDAPTKLGHKAEITAVTYTSSAEHVASASIDGAVKLWDAHTGNLVRTVLTVQRTTILCLQIDPSGLSLFAGCGDGQVRSCRLPEVEKKGKFTMKLPPLKEKKLRKKLPEITPDIHTQKQSVREDEDKKKKKLEGGENAGEETNRTDAGGAASQEEGDVTVRKIGKDGKKLRKKRKNSAESVQVERAGTTVEEDGGEDRDDAPVEHNNLPELNDTEVVIEVEQDRILGSGIALRRAVHSVEGHVSVTVSDNQRQLNLRDGKLHVTRNLQGHVDVVTDLAMSHSGIWLASASLDGIIKVWETRTAICKWSQHCFRAGLSAVGMDAELEMAVGGSTLGDVQIIDLAAASVVAEYEASTFKVIKTQLAEQGKMVVSGYEDGLVVLRDLRDNKNSVTIDPKKVDRERTTNAGAKKGLLGQFGFGSGKAEGVRMDCMAASDDVGLVVRGMGRLVEVWDVRMQKKLSVDRSHTAEVQAVQLMDKGRLLVSGGADCMIRLHLLNGDTSSTDTAVEHAVDADAVTARTLSTTLTRTPSMVGRTEGERRGKAQWLYGEEPELAGRVASKLCYYSSGAVSCIGGFESSSMLVGDEGGRLHHLSLQPGKDP